MTKIQANIAEYMNGMSPNREYNAEQVSIMHNSIKEESQDREIDINTRTKLGKKLIDKRAAEIANKRAGDNYIFLPSDIRLFKKCRAWEYQDRTGKCAWGIPSVCRKLGYDPETRREII